MAVSEEDFARYRSEADARLNSISVDIMGALTSLADHKVRFDRIDDRFAQIDSRFAHIEARLVQIDGRFDAMDRRITALDQKFDAKIDTLSDRLDRRFSWQTAMFGMLGAIVVFAEPIRAALGL